MFLFLNGPAALLLTFHIYFVSSIAGYSTSKLPIYRKRMAGAIYSEAQMAVARAFADARRTAGMKQADLAAAIGKRQSYISDIERGQRRVDLLELFAVAIALKVKPADLYAKLTDSVPDDFRL